MKWYKKMYHLVRSAKKYDSVCEVKKQYKYMIYILFFIYTHILLTLLTLSDFHSVPPNYL